MSSIYTKQELIDKIKALDISIEEAQLNKSYELDTGQGRQKVIFHDLSELRKLRDMWIGELGTACGNGLMRIQTGRFK